MEVIIDMTNRMFATVKSKPCPFKCIYCFTKCGNFKRNIYLDTLTTKELYKITDDVETIQPACDTEFLLHPNWKEILLRLSILNKNISFATKMSINDEDVEFLSAINKLLKVNNKILNIGVTIIKIDNYKELEPCAPSPIKRIETLKKLNNAGIKTNVIIRPIFPSLTTSEINQIIGETYKYSFGYLVGPLYLNENVESFLKNKKYKYDLIKKCPEWNQSKELNVMYCHEIITNVAEIASKYRKQVFFSNEQCISYLTNCNIGE